MLRLKMAEILENNQVKFAARLTSELHHKPKYRKILSDFNLIHTLGSTEFLCKRNKQRKLSTILRLTLQSL